MWQIVRAALFHRALWLIALVAFVPVCGLAALHVPWVVSHGSYGVWIFLATQLFGFFALPTLLYHRAVAHVLGLPRFPVSRSTQASAGFLRGGVLLFLLPVILSGLSALLPPQVLTLQVLPGTPAPFNDALFGEFVWPLLVMFVVTEPWTGLFVAQGFLKDVTHTTLSIPWRASVLIPGYAAMGVMALLFVLFFVGNAHAPLFGIIPFYLVTVWYGVIATLHVQALAHDISHVTPSQVVIQ